MSHRKKKFSLGTAAVALAAVLSVACPGPRHDGTATDGNNASGKPSLEAPGFLAGADPSQWVKIYDPARAMNGYTLAFYGRRIPMLLDMNGRVVHSWPAARVKSRIRLLPNGSILALALGRSIVEYDWDGQLVWEVPIEDALPHHDVIRLANGNTMVLILRTGQRTDDILEIDSTGRTVWEWRAGEHLTDYYDPRTAMGEITHLNSVQELPANKWFDAGDQRFRPGNLLVSARNLDAVFIIDRTTRDVVWYYDHELDRQHEALMVQQGDPGAGNILIFDNGYASTHVHRQSRVLEINPSDGEVLWRYGPDGFYSPTGGIQQPLPNGNILISSSRGRRAFEITRAGRTVWEWAPPFEPNRPVRVAYDHCPQLAELERPKPRPVRPAQDYRHVDPRTYSYARPGAIVKVRIDDSERRALREQSSCRRVFVPPEADIHLGYGISRRGVRRVGRADYEARFEVAVSEIGSPDNVILVDDTLAVSQSNWEEPVVALDEYALRWVDLCLSIQEPGIETEGEVEKFAFWINPHILPRERTAAEPTDSPTEPLSPEEAEVQKQHLKALGYID